MSISKIQASSLEANATNLVIISTATASADSIIEFDLDNTYDHYIFRFNKIHSSNDNVDFRADVSQTSDTDYGDATITYLNVRDYQSESGATGIGEQEGASYGTTTYINLAKSTSGDNDHCLDGTFEIYNPSSTTFTTGFRADIVSIQYNSGGDRAKRTGIFGDIRNETAVDKIKFFFEAGTIETGSITHYGVKT